MIDVERLKNVKRLVTHANCPDGVASALIVKDALPDVEVLFVKHGTEQHRNLEAGLGDLYCDFTPFEPRAHWLDLGVIVLDHHPTQRDVTMKFVEAGLGAYGENDKNECGAWLAYEHVWKPLRQTTQEVRRNVEDFARLAGVRDTWKKQDSHWQAACEQAEELMFWPLEISKSDGSGITLEQFINPRALKLGHVLFEKKLDHARTAIGEAHTFTTVKGTRVLMFQGVTPTSDAAEILEDYEKDKKRKLRDLVEPIQPRAVISVSHPQLTILENSFADIKTDIVCGFHYRVDAGKLQLQFSTRSHTGYDVGAFAKARGGGGHTAAAGFTVEQSPEVGANPYAVFRLLLEEWEAR